MTVPGTGGTPVDWELELVVPLWQGGGEPDVALGAERLARLARSGGDRRTVLPATARALDETHGGFQDLGAVVGHLDAVTALLDSLGPRRVLTIGGDCTVAVPAVSHLARLYPGLRVAWVDAHGDLHTPASGPSSHAHGMPLRALLGAGHPRMVPRTTVAPGRVALVGTRALDDAEEQLVADHQLLVVRSTQVREGVSTEVLQQLEAWLPRGGPVYLHLDLDVLDPLTWPAVAVPEPDGIGVPALVDIIRSLRSRGDLVGTSITEYAPSRTHDPGVVLPVLRELGLTPS